MCTMSILCVGDITFDDREMMRDAPNIDDSLYKRGSDESTMLSEMDNRKDQTIDNTMEKPMDLGLDEPIRDDGFGAEMGIGSGILGKMILCILFSYLSQVMT